MTTDLTTYRLRWAALAALLVAEAMNLLDSTIVQVAAPVIHTDLPGPTSDIQWFGAAYTLPFAVLLITGGRLGDIAGRRRVFRIGVAGFVIASLCCALAPSAGLLVGARAVQGAAAALVIPQTIGLIRALFAGDEMAKALGCIGPVMGLAAVSGPVLGGLLTHADLFGSSWRAVFLVNVPLGLAVLAGAPLLREDRAAYRPRLDVVGTLLVAAGTGLVVYPLISGTDPVLVVAGVVVLVLFGAQQYRRRGRDPLVEPSLFRDRGFPAALVTSVLFFGVMTGLMLVVVLRAQLGLGADVLTAGLTVLPLSAGMAVASWVAGSRLVPRYGPRIMAVGLAVLLVGVLAATVPGLFLIALAGCGLGIGLFTTSFFTTALQRVRPQETGSAAGLLNAVQQLGSTLGVAVLGGVVLGGDSVLDGARLAFWMAAGVVVVTAVTARWMVRR